MLTSYPSTFNNIPIRVNDVGSNFGDANLLHQGRTALKKDVEAIKQKSVKIARWLVLYR